MGLHLHGQRCRARLTQECAQKLRRPPLALAIIGHQQGGKGHQPWARLTLRHARGQFRTGRLPAGRATKPMPLILAHVRLDLGQFPHLMPQRLRVTTRQLLAAAPTFAGLKRLYVVALFGGNQRPLMFRMARLPAASLFRLPLLPPRLCVRMLRARRQRGVLRRRSHPRFERRDPIQKLHYEGAHRRRHLGIEFRRNSQFISLGGRHDLCRRRKPDSCPDQFRPKNAPRP